MAVLGVVPSHKRLHPAPRLLQILKPLAWIRWRVLQRSEQGLRVRVVIAHAGSAERGHHAQLLQRRQHRGPLHRAAVVRVQRQLIWADVLAKAGFADQRRGVFCRLLPMHLPAHDQPAEHVQHPVQAHELPLDRAGQIRDVPAPHLVGPVGHPRWAVPPPFLVTTLCLGGSPARAL